MTFSSSEKFIDRLESSLDDFNAQNKSHPSLHSSDLESKLDQLIKELRESKSTQQPYLLPQYNQNMQQQPMQMHPPQQPFSNDSDAKEIDRLRRKMLRMQDRMDDMDMYNRSMQQQPMQMPPQQQNKTLYYLLLILGAATFLYMPIAGMAILAAAVASASGNKDNAQDVQNYLTAVHQNQHLRDREIHNLKRELRETNREISRNSRGF